MAALLGRSSGAPSSPPHGDRSHSFRAPPGLLLAVALPVALIGVFLEGAFARLGAQLGTNMTTSMESQQKVSRGGASGKAFAKQKRQDQSIVWGFATSFQPGRDRTGLSGGHQRRDGPDGFGNYPAWVGTDAVESEEEWIEPQFSEGKNGQLVEDYEPADFGAPEHMASDLEFEDEDPTPRNISGKVVIGKPEDDRGVAFYNLYWGQGDQKMTGDGGLPVTEDDYNRFLIQAIPASHLEDVNPEYDIESYDEELQRMSGVFVPPGATHLVVFTANNEGIEMPKGLAVPISDLSAEWECEQYEPGAKPGEASLVPCPSKLRQLQIRQKRNAQTTFTSELAGALGLPDAREKSYAGR